MLQNTPHPPQKSQRTKSLTPQFEYTRLEKRCRVKSINDAQWDTMKLWEDDRGKFVTEFRFLLFKIFSFQDNLNNKG